MDVNQAIRIASGQEQRYVRMGKCNRCGLCCVAEECIYLRHVEGLAVCEIYGREDRPEKCKIYPGNPPITRPECGYYFYDKVAGKEVKFGDLME